MRIGTGIRLISTTLGLLGSQWWDSSRIAEYQRRRLIDILRHSIEHVPFYSGLGIAAGDINSIADLQRFPITSKRDVQSQPDRFLARGFEKHELNVSMSSGMSGEPTSTYFDDGSWLVTKFALKARRVLNEVRWPRQRVMIMSASHGGSWSSVPTLGLVSVAYMSVSDSEPIENKLSALLRFEPTIIYGLPSYLGALADTARKQSLELPRVPLIYTSSEVLSPAARAALERAYGGRVIDIYGSSEFKEIAVQCLYGRYHVNFESVYLETVRDDDTEPPRLLVTSLVNKAMPLVRYEIGDMAEIVATPCRCGRKSMQLVEVQGRVAEMIEFPDGTRLSPYVLEEVIERDPTVRFFTIAHESPWALRIEILADSVDVAPHRRSMEQELRKRLPPQASVRCVALEKRHGSVKRRAVSREF